MRVSLLFISIFLVLGSALPAHAASKKELEAKIIQLEQRLGALETRMLTGDPAAERLMQRMDALESSQRSMTGEVERLRYENETLQEEVRALASQIVTLQTISEDMQLHLQAVEIVANEGQQSVETSTPIIYGETGISSASGIYEGGSSFPPPPAITGGDQSTEQGNDISRLAMVGQEMMSEGDFSGAQTVFRQYLDLNPEATDKGDVYFWLGETYYAKSGFTSAAEAYIASMRAAPKGDYAPEAMVKLAATARALGKTNMACQTLASFPAQYPNAVSAVREKARIEKQRSEC
jgi:tol-pal system protein YbgF